MGIGIEISRTVWPGFQGSGGVSCVPFCHLSIRDIIITGYTLQRPESSDMESCCFWLPLITKVVFYGSNVFLRMGDSRGLLTLGGWGNKLKRRQRERWTILELFMSLLIGYSIHRGKFREGIRDCESNRKPDPGEWL